MPEQPCHLAITPLLTISGNFSIRLMNFLHFGVKWAHSPPLSIKRKFDVINVKKVSKLTIMTKVNPHIKRILEEMGRNFQTLQEKNCKVLKNKNYLIIIIFMQFLNSVCLWPLKLW